MVTTGLRKPILLALLTQPLLEASSAEAGQRKWIFPQCQDALARPLHPLLWFLLVLLKGALQFAQEINIPNIISSQFRQPREQLGALQAGGGGEHVHFLELSWESSLQETPRNCSKQTKKLLGNLATGSPERPVQLCEEAGSQQTWHRWHWASSPATNLLKVPDSVCSWQQLGVEGRSQDCPMVQMRTAEAQRREVTIPQLETSLSSE